MILRCRWNINGDIQTPSKKLLTPLQVNYFHNLQWKNKIRPMCAPETISMQDIKEGYKKWKKNKYLTIQQTLMPL